MDSYKRVYGIGKYAAVRAPRSDLIELRAIGILPCSNYIAALEKRPERVIPPQWDMVFYTADFCLKAMKPFELTVPMNDASGGANHVLVRDATGEVEVPIVDEIPAERSEGFLSSADLFRVYARLPKPEQGHHGCFIVPDGTIVSAIYYTAFGPASYQECDTWMPDNCRKGGIEASSEIPWPLAK